MTDDDADVDATEPAGEKESSEFALERDLSRDGVEGALSCTAAMDDGTETGVGDADVACEPVG